MKRLTVFLPFLLLLLFARAADEKIILLNEGNWEHDNGRITYFEDDAVVSNQWFRDVNGTKLGDTPNDIIRVSDNLIAIAVNWSNIVQFIDAGGKAVAAIEDVPNNRRMATDGRYVFLSSFGHECMTEKGMLSFTKGYVAKIDVSTFKVVDAVEVGYEPEGIAYYQGHLFVANTGGYAFQENHDYETTVTVLDASTLATVRNIDTGQINLCGEMSQSGRYLCINSPGDYYEVMAATIIFDCQAAIDGKPDAQCFHKFDYAATCNTVDLKGNFYAIGSRYSYIESGYTFNYVYIDPREVFETDGVAGVYEGQFPGAVLDDVKKMEMPYSIYVNPYTGYIYATDAAGFVEGGTLYQWNPQGVLQGKYGVYINPGHFLALRPDKFGAIDGITADPDEDAGPVYNLQGIPVDRMIPGRIYIRRGKKFTFRGL